MPKLTLQFEGVDLRAFVIGSGVSVVTIGRLPDNVVIVDNPAVSGHHARVIRDGDQLILEDLRSTNGTFVNGQPVNRHVLRHGDSVLVGKHQLTYDQTEEARVATPAPSIQGLGDTVYLDTKQHRALRETLESARAEAARSVNRRPAEIVPRRIGVLRVVSGRANRDVFHLSAHTSLIGRSDSALVRLHGWFKPSVAVAIARSGDSYAATPLGGKPFLNEERLTRRQDLKDGDLLSVSGLTLEFHWNDSVVTESAA